MAGSGTDTAVLALAVVGAAVVVKWALSALSALLSAASSGVHPKTYGKWAVVTGATDGIGRAFCFSLAQRGLNVVLMSRTQSKLEETAKAVEEAHGVQTRVLAVDFSKFDTVAQARVRAELEQLDGLGVLVNNVGMSYPFPLYFDELADEDVAGMLELNVNATTYMTRLALPIMLQQRKGAIINVGSSAGLHPSPLLALYSSTKAFVETFSHALHTEYASKGICVQAHVPFFIVSKLSKYKRPSAFVPSAEAYAEKAMGTLGRGPVVSPHFPHRVAAAIMDAAPEWLVQRAALSFHLGIRAKGLRKREREAKQT